MSNQNPIIVQAVRDSLYTEMSLDGGVLVIGEDVDKNGGVFRAMEGLRDESGDDRVVDTLPAESGIVGATIGMTAMELGPVPEAQFSGFMYPRFDQIVSHMGRFRNRTCGRYTLPMVLRAPYGGGIRAPKSHSESKEIFYTHETDLKIVILSTPYDTKGLLVSATHDPDPVIFTEPKLIYRAFRGEVPEDDYTVLIGETAARREGADVSMLTSGMITRSMLEAVGSPEEEDINAETVDVRTTSPLDREAVVESFKKTSRTVVIHETPRNGGLGAEVMATVQEETLSYQEAPVKRVTGYDVPYPLYMLEDYYLPSVARVEEDIRGVMNF